MMIFIDQTTFSNTYLVLLYLSLGEVVSTSIKTNFRNFVVGQEKVFELKFTNKIAELEHETVYNRYSAHQEIFSKS